VIGQPVRVKTTARARAKRRRVLSRARPAAVSLHSRRSRYRSLRTSPRASHRSRISCRSCSPARWPRSAGIARAEHRVRSAPRCSTSRTAVSAGPGSSPVAIFDSVGPHATSNRRGGQDHDVSFAPASLETRTATAVPAAARGQERCLGPRACHVCAQRGPTAAIGSRCRPRRGQSALGLWRIGCRGAARLDVVAALKGWVSKWGLLVRHQDDKPISIRRVRCSTC